MKAGDTLWYVPESRRLVGGGGEPRELVITKVARVWLHVNDPRGAVKCVNVKTLCADGGGYTSPGRCYPSRAEYEAQQETNEAWNELQRRMRNDYRQPEGLTAQRVRLALGLMHMGGDTDPLAVVQALLAKLPEPHVTAYFAREELAAVRRLFA